MAFNSLLKNLIKKTVEEYTEAATIDPEKFQSKGTVRDELLDVTLERQEKERKELWDRYYQLKRQLKENGDDKVFEEAKDNGLQLALGLIKEDHLLTEEIQRQVTEMDLLDRPSEVEIELKFREELQTSIIQYKFALKYLKKEVLNFTKQLEREKQRLVHMEELHTKLIETQNPINDAVGIRERIRELESSFKDDTKDLMDFLNENYPPHLVDGPEDQLRDSSNMNNILEELMNRAVMLPNDPYMTLIPGTYWTPHVQSLIQASIAEYHQEDPSKIRLADFSV